MSKPKKFKFGHRAIAASLLCCGAYVGAVAAVGLWVYQTDGVETVFPLDEQPSITYDGPMVRIEDPARSLELNLAEVRNFSFGDTSSIEELQANPSDGIVRGLRPGLGVEIFSADGKILFSTIAGPSGHVDIPFERLPRTILIIRTPGATYKVMNK